MPRQKPLTRTLKAKAAFLQNFAQHGVVLHACKEAGVCRGSFYKWLESDGQFKALYAQAEQDAVDELEREAKRRAVDGWEEPVYQKGEQVGTVRKFSDNLLIMLLKGKKPETYRERVDLNGRLGVTHAELSDILAAGRQRLQQEDVEGKS